MNFDSPGDFSVLFVTSVHRHGCNTKVDGCYFASIPSIAVDIRVKLWREDRVLQVNDRVHFPYQDIPIVSKIHRYTSNTSYSFDSFTKSIEKKIFVLVVEAVLHCLLIVFGLLAVGNAIAFVIVINLVCLRPKVRCWKSDRESLEARWSTRVLE